MVVKWSACMPSTLTTQVLITLNSTIFLLNWTIQGNENKQKVAGVCPLVQRDRIFDLHHFERKVTSECSQCDQIWRYFIISAKF